MRWPAGQDLRKWWVLRRSRDAWVVIPPNPEATRNGRPDPFPSWREAYDYAHTHPSNRKETP